MRGLDMVANAAVLTLLTAVCSIPLVTIGAALSASYEAAWAAKEGRGYLLRTYFSAFKRNFPVATAIWSVLAAMAHHHGLGLAVNGTLRKLSDGYFTQRATVRWHIAVYDFGCSYHSSHRNRTNSGQSAMASQRIVSIADTGLRHSGTTANTTVRTCTKTLCK